VNTALHCAGCGARCGTGHRGDQEGYGLPHENVIVAVRAKLASQPGWTEPYPPGTGPLGAVMTSNLNRPDEWPLWWTCSACQQAVALDRDQAARVGNTNRVVCCSMSRDG
jgi:hypothetical protein